MRRLMVFVLCLGGSVAHATAPDVATETADEALLETSPAGVAMATRLLERTFERGVRDIDHYAYLSKLVLQHTLGLAGCREAGDGLACSTVPDGAAGSAAPTEAEGYLKAAIPMAYNLAANTWAGWGEGVGDIEERHRRLGLEAARLAVALAAEARLGPERRRNGYWILGAQLIAAGDLGAAADAFRTSRDLADEAGLAQAALMASGWIHVCEALAGRDSSRALAAVKERLRDSEHGDFYARQYDAALKAFAGR